MLLSLLSFAGLAAAAAHAPHRRSEDRPKVIPGRYIIQLQPGADPAVIDEYLGAARRLARRDYEADTPSYPTDSVADDNSVCAVKVVTVTVTPTVTVPGGSAATYTPGVELEQCVERTFTIGHGKFNAYIGNFDESVIKEIEKLDEVLAVEPDEYVYLENPYPGAGTPDASTYPTASYPTAPYPTAPYPTGSTNPTGSYPVANGTVSHYPSSGPSGISSAYPSSPSNGSTIPDNPSGNGTSGNNSTGPLTTQQNSIWSLADLSHKDGISDLTTYTYIYDSSAGVGTTAYVFDSGIRATHEEFEGRVRFGINGLTNSTTGASNGNNDNVGHGTHVAGTIIGKTFGVAKKASVVDVKVFDADSASLSSILAGIDWAVKDVTARNIASTAVFSMSFGTRSTSTALDNAIKAAYDQGILTVVSAGNDDAEIGNTTPARLAEAFTVGYTNQQRRRVNNNDGVQGSNYGPELDVWAPGFQIVSADSQSDTGNRTDSGTSMATPLVSGLVCYLRGLNKALGTPQQVTSQVLALGDNGVVADAKDSANVLVYNGNGA